MIKIDGIKKVLIIIAIGVGIAVTIPFLWMTLVILFPNGAKDHITIKTSTNEKFYFDGEWENTFPKLYGCTYALYEINKGKKVLIRGGKSNRSPEFYLYEDRFNVEEDVFSAKYTYKKDTYTLHKMDYFFLYKKNNEKKYEFVLKSDVFSNSKEYMFFFPFIKKSLQNMM